MRRRLLSLLLALAILPLTSGSAFALGTLDQEALPGGGNVTSGGDVYQTFTVGLAGDLDTVSLYGFTSFFSGTWNVAITAVAAGVPTGPDLATGSAPALVDQGWTDIPVSPALPVTPGLQLAIVARGPTPWWADAAASYAGGSSNVFEDQAFRTYVTVAPPVETPVTNLIVTSIVGSAEAGPFSGSVTVAAGATVWRRIVITNGSTTSLGGLTVSDTAGPLPSACPELPASLGTGESWTCTFSQTAAPGTTSYVTSATAGGVSGGAPVTVMGTVAAGTPAAGTVGSKLGLASAPGAYTAGTKVASVGRYVTWQANLGAAAAGTSVGVYVSVKGGDGSWGGWTRQTGRAADATGTVLYSRREASASWLSVRFSVDGLSFTKATQARWR